MTDFRRRQQQFQQSFCAGFVEWVVVVAAFRGLDAGGTTVFADALGDQLQSGAQELFEGLESRFRDADSAGIAVVDEDRREASVDVKRAGDAADVPPVASGQERQHPDCGVFDGVNRSAQIQPRLHERQKTARILKLPGSIPFYGNHEPRTEFYVSCSNSFEDINGLAARRLPIEIIIHEQSAHKAGETNAFGESFLEVSEL